MYEITNQTNQKEEKQANQLLKLLNRFLYYTSKILCYFLGTIIFLFTTLSYSTLCGISSLYKILSCRFKKLKNSVEKNNH